MKIDQPPAHARYAPVPYEHHWLTSEEQNAAAQQFLATMARRRVLLSDTVDNSAPRLIAR